MLAPVTARQESVTRVAVGVLLGALLAGAGAWITLADEFQTRTEILEMIKNRGPIDVALLEYRLKEQDTKLREVEEKIDIIDRSINEVMVVLRALTKDLEIHAENSP